jgi:hypothetical protein
MVTQNPYVFLLEEGIFMEQSPKETIHVVISLPANKKPLWLWFALR